MAELLQVFTGSPFFGLVLCIFSYKAGLVLQEKLKTPLANPLLIASVLCVCALLVFRIPYEEFKKGADLIHLFLAPATAVLAVSMYHQLPVLKKNILPAVIGTAVGASVCVGSIVLFCRLFGFDESMYHSLFAKSVTTPIALAVTEQRGGVTSLTMAAIVITGLMGAVFSPFLIRLFRVNNSIAAGLAIGTSSHALGTTRALKIGEVEGAMSSIAIGLAGLATVILALFF